MKYKAVVYHPFNEINLGFTKHNFTELFKNFQDISFYYPENECEFNIEIIDADFVIALKISNDLYKIAKKLKAVFTCMAGRDAIPENINIRRYYGYFHGRLIKETLLSAILFFNQRLLGLIECKNKIEWANAKDYGNRIPIEKQSIAIIGYGAIGKYCADYLSKIGIKNIYAVQRTHDSGKCHISGASYVNISKIYNILDSIDHVVSFLPESNETNDIFDSNFFSKMNKMACFYNFGRGNSVVEDDLVIALEKGKIHGAYLDVFRNEPLQKESAMWKTKNLVITPHISTYYQNYFTEYGYELVTQLKKEISHLEIKEV